MGKIQVAKDDNTPRIVNIKRIPKRLTSATSGKLATKAAAATVDVK